MIIVASLGILAGTVTLVVASVVLRAGRGRPDNRLFAILACLAGMSALALPWSCSRAEASGGGDAMSLAIWWLEWVTAAVTALFSYAFPRGRRPTSWVWALAGAVLALGTVVVFGGQWAQGIRDLAPWFHTGAYGGAGVLVLAQLPAVAKGARVGLWAVLAAFGARWLSGFAWFQGVAGLPPESEPAILVPHDLVGVVGMLVIGWAVLRYHLLDVRRVFRQAAAAWAAAIVVSGYAAGLLFLLPRLPWELEPGGLALIGLLPPVLLSWLVWTFREELTGVASAFDPHRGVRRELMERVLAVTGHVVDPEAVLAMIRAAMLEVFPNAQVDFRRAAGVRFLRGISATMPSALEEALREQDARVVETAKLSRGRADLRDLWPDRTDLVLLPVRRGGTIYGVFELVAGGRVDRDDLETASAMADHLAVKLENVSLSSSLGKAGRELQSIRTFLEDLIESLPVGIVGISGPDLQVRLWNPFEARRTGIPSSEVLGKSYLEEVAGRHVEAAIAESIRQEPEEVLSFPNVGWTRHGTREAVDVTVAPLRARAGGERGYVLIMVDATERTALQQEVEEFRRLAALGEFAAAIAHDIRTPLSSIRMSVQILRSKVDLPPADMEYFDLTLEAISRLGRDVEELLDFTKPVFLRVDALALQEVVEDAKQEVCADVGADAQIRVDIPEALEIPADEVQVRKVLVNLLQNAVQASEPAGLVWVEAADSGDEVRIVVRDEGRGIDLEELDRIWDPFFTTRTDGTGLGLAIVRKAVTAHGGRVEVTSEPGGGAQFEVFLPARRETEVVVPIEECRKAGALHH